MIGRYRDVVKRQVGFNLVLGATMASATFSLTVFGVLPQQLISVFGLSRAQLGLLGTASSITGAVLSPAIGAITDRVGARRATVATLITGGLALLAIAGAPSYAWLLLAAALSGVGQAGGNPSTNKLISHHVEPGRRGLVTGLKQSGVQFGTFLGGLLLPIGAISLGWRPTVALTAAFPLGVAGYALMSVPRDPLGERHAPQRPARGVLAGILPLAAYGFLLGAGGSAIFAFISLFGQEELGVSNVTGGRVVALMGVCGVVGRIAWGRAAERTLGTVPALRWVSALAVAAAVVLATAESWGEPALWVAAAVTGFSASAWNSVGMLAVIQQSPVATAGRASGVVLAGFLTGLGAGAPLFGWWVDQAGGYRTGWLVVGVLFAASIPVLGSGRASARSS